MNKRKIVASVLFLAFVLFSHQGFAGGGIHTVAVFNLNADSQQLRETGRDISTLLSVMLSRNENTDIVEREQLDMILGEIGLSLSGIVDENQALQAGRLAGAKILVTGRIFLSGDDMIATARVIGTETSRVKVVMATSSPREAVSVISEKLAKEISGVIEKDGDGLVAGEKKKEDVLAKLMERLSGKSLPSVTIFAREEHLKRAAVDPSVETEMLYLMRKCGFKLKEEPFPAGSAEAFFKEKKYLDTANYTADIIVVSEAVSEFAGQRAGLISCRGSVEIRAIDRRTKQVLAIGRATHTGVGVSEAITAKTVLQEAAVEVLEKFIHEMAEKWKSVSRQ